MGYITIFTERISIHALREEGDDCCGAVLGGRMIFLSTPSARRATSNITTSPGICQISIHALREEGDKRQPKRSSWMMSFLSTPSARRATRSPTAPPTTE